VAGCRLSAPVKRELSELALGCVAKLGSGAVHGVAPVPDVIVAELVVVAELGVHVVVVVGVVLVVVPGVVLLVVVLLVDVVGVVMLVLVVGAVALVDVGGDDSVAVTFVGLVKYSTIM
jgi:hypothetical protein